MEKIQEVKTVNTDEKPKKPKKPIINLTKEKFKTFNNRLLWFLHYINKLINRPTIKRLCKYRDQEGVSPEAHPDRTGEYIIYKSRRSPKYKFMFRVSRFNDNIHQEGGRPSEKYFVSLIVTPDGNIYQGTSIIQRFIDSYKKGALQEKIKFTTIKPIAKHCENIFDKYANIMYSRNKGMVGNNGFFFGNEYKVPNYISDSELIKQTIHDKSTMGAIPTANIFDEFSVVQGLTVVHTCRWRSRYKNRTNGKDYCAVVTVPPVLRSPIYSRMYDWKNINISETKTVYDQQLLKLIRMHITKTGNHSNMLQVYGRHMIPIITERNKYLKNCTPADGDVTLVRLCAAKINRWRYESNTDEKQRLVVSITKNKNHKFDLEKDSEGFLEGLSVECLNILNRTFSGYIFKYMEAMSDNYITKNYITPLRKKIRSKEYIFYWHPKKRKRVYIPKKNRINLVPAITPLNKREQELYKALFENFEEKTTQPLYEGGTTQPRFEELFEENTIEENTIEQPHEEEVIGEEESSEPPLKKRKRF